MRFILLFLVWIAFASVTQAQSGITQIKQTARNYNNRGDHANAVIVLKQGLREFPKSLELENGASLNEPTTYAVRVAIEQAVYELIIDGEKKGLWRFKKDNK